ncbi:phytoene synthase [Rhodotorula toruloides]|uniref:Bifunctional lycopene cyclase/phytoene synthase n=1 Tax=Rhodotorula toruloides TaxID=5286 RepID=A0A2Z6EYV3_RHOTO|nr:phytoene synthase [Rhodotorula toruloides]GEM08703.1 phytoene synthase [Rhodotorula toruloides]
MGGLDYWLVHLRWTIPPALVLWGTFRKLRTRRDVYKTLFLEVIAITATIPWDSYLIRHRIWSYPESSVVGPTLFAIPYEEIFFFFIQTYITATVYALFSRPVVHAVLLPRKPSDGRVVRYIGTAAFLGIFALAWAKLAEGGEGTYLALIVGWVAPFLALLWFIASNHILAMPPWAVGLPILLPTLYLWECDARALQRGTWVIEKGTKLGLAFRGLEIEEAVFFLLTNVMIVFGLVACDYCLAVHDLCSYDTRTSSAFPPLRDFLPILLNTPDAAQRQRIEDLQAAIEILSVHSKSFSTASQVFEGRLRLDLLSLYAWCRVCDDLIDNASTVVAAEFNIDKISGFLDLLYPPSSSSSTSLPARVSNKHFEAALPGLSEPERSAFRLLSLLPIARPPLDELLEGFRTDLSFLALSDSKGVSTNGSSNGKSTIAAELPIKTDSDLLVYANNVASSVADLCVQLVWAHCTPYSHTPAHSVPHDPRLSEAENAQVLAAAREMGQALQLVNIARDVPADLKIGRIYLPGTGLDTPVPELTKARRDLLARANEMAAHSKAAIEKLPQEARGGIRAACLVYLSIGDAVGKALDEGQVMERARVSKGARARKAWQAL